MLYYIVGNIQNKEGSFRNRNICKKKYNFLDIKRSEEFICFKTCVSDSERSEECIGFTMVGLFYVYFFIKCKNSGLFEPQYKYLLMYKLYTYNSLT